MMLKHEDKMIRKLSKIGLHYREIAKILKHHYTGVFKYMKDKGISLNLDKEYKP